MHIDNLSYLNNDYLNHLKIINNIPFTSREIDIIACINNMRGSSKIASILNISPKTAENHITNIKRKINYGARDGIIDFVEKAGKSKLIRKHYQHLLIRANFNKRLQQVSNIIRNKAPTCYFVSFSFNDKNKESLISAIQTHLKLASIKLIICAAEDEKIGEFKQDNHFIYIVSENITEGSIIFKALQKSKNMPNCFTFLLIENIKFDIIEQIPKNTYINFLEKKNYYLTIFEILKRLLPNIDLSNIISELKSYEQSIDEQIIPVNPVIDFIPSKAIYKKLLIISILLIILITITILGYNKMLLNQQDQHKELKQLIITSYMPEILTGYEHFIGRKKELSQIKKILEKENIIIITGCAGIGKSSLAIEYGKNYKTSEIVRYFNASSKAKIDQQYRELAQEFNINVNQKSSNFVMLLINNKLNTIPAKILFIFDNVDQYDDIKEYLVNLPKNILAIITTRKPQLVANKAHVTLEEFSNEEAALYLKSSLQDRCFSDVLIHKLIESNGTLPYDIKCLAAYFLENPFEDNKIDIQKITTVIKNKLFQEFIISKDQTKQQAWNILQYAANLDPDFISMEIIKELFPTDVDLSSIALKKLESLSLISIINNKNDHAGFRIHRKLQQNVKAIKKNHPTYTISSEKLTDHLVNALDTLYPTVTHNPSNLWQTASGLLSHIEKLLNNQEIIDSIKNSKINLTNLYYKSAKYYLNVDINYPKALKYAAIALDRSHTLHKNNQYNLANISNIIGVVYRKLGKTKESEKHSKEALEIRKKLYSGNHPDIAESLYNIGMVYHQQGKILDGLKYLQMALDMHKHLYYNNHYDTAYSLSAIGICYIDLKQFEKALEHFKESLKIFTTLDQINSEKISELHSNIAYGYNKLGNHAEALKYAQTSLDIIKKAYPDGHPTTSFSLNDLAISLIQLNNNNIQQGLDLLHQSLDMAKKFNKERHFISAYTLQHLGWGYYKKGDYQKAMEYAEKALNLRREIYSTVPNHHEIAETLCNLGNIHLALKDKKLALNFYQEALTMYISLSSPQHTDEINELKQKINELLVQNLTK
jgi:tetratricopeptide (TPR) repeat protein/DNA-binding CsgD family transcriptional regulator